MDNMLNFIDINESNISELSKYYKNSEYKMSDYSVGIKYMWRDVVKPSFVCIDGCLIVKEEYDGICRFDFPLKTEEDADIDLALSRI